MILRLSFVFALLFATAASAQTKWDGRILDIAMSLELSHEELVSIVSNYPIIALGEVHYTPAVQTAQGRLIDDVGALNVYNVPMTLAWEFLNASDRDITDREYGRFVRDEITAKELLISLQKNEMAGVYAPVLEALKKHSGILIGTNLSREIKRKVVQGGLKNAPEGSVPEGFEMGGPNYLTRFKEAMGEHAPPDTLQNYFEAQCLTDDVMAVNVLKAYGTSQVFFLVGSFHTDYFDGAVQRLVRRAGPIPFVTVRFVDASEYTESELLALFRHSTYGDIADFVIVVNEPKASYQTLRSR